MENKNVFQKPQYVVLFAILCTMLWGCCFPLIKLGYRYFDIPSEDVASKILLAGIRFMIAGVAVLLFFLSRRDHDSKTVGLKGSINSILWLCLFQTVLHYIFTYIGLSNTTGAKGSVLKELSTFIIILAAPLVYSDSKFGKKELLGCVFGIGGIAIMNLDGNFNMDMTLFGEGFVLLAACSVAMGHLMSKKLVENKNPVLITGVQQLLGGVVLVGIGLFQKGHLGSVTMAGVLSLLVLSAATAVAYVVWVVLLQNNAVSKVAIFGLGTPIFGTLASGLFLGESIFKPNNILALGLVCLGIFIVNYQKNLHGLREASNERKNLVQ